MDAIQQTLRNKPILQNPCCWSNCFAVQTQRIVICVVIMQRRGVPSAAPVGATIRWTKRVTVWIMISPTSATPSWNASQPADSWRRYTPHRSRASLPVRLLLSLLSGGSRRSVWRAIPVKFEMFGRVPPSQHQTPSQAEFFFANRPIKLYFFDASGGITPSPAPLNRPLLLLRLLPARHMSWCSMTLD